MRPETIDKIAPWVAGAVEATGGTHTVADLVEAVMAGKINLFVGERCFCATEFVNYPRRRVLNVFLAGGDLAEKDRLEPLIEAWARGGGAEEIVFSGKLSKAARRRIGWAKACPGYQATHAYFRRRIEP